MIFRKTLADKMPSKPVILIRFSPNFSGKQRNPMSNSTAFSIISPLGMGEGGVEAVEAASMGPIDVVSTYATGSIYNH